MHFSIAAISKTVEALPVDTLVRLNWQLVQLSPSWPLLDVKRPVQHLTRMQNI